MNMQAANSKRKNVLIIMSDEQRVDTLGCYGNKHARTPNIDKLAEEGIRFDSCWTPYPLCCPARASLWTGMMPHNHHVLANWFHIRPELQDGGFIQSFTDQGYHTTYTGKWHVPGTTPKRLGYCSWAAIPDVLEGRDRGRYISEYRQYAVAHGYELVEKNIENLTIHDLNKKTKNGHVDCGTSHIKLEHYLETWQTQKFLEQLDNCPEDKPFFAVCSYNAPHFPMIVPDPYDRLIKPEEVELPKNFCTGLEGKPKEVISSKYYQHTKDLDVQEWRELIAHYWGFCSLVDTQVGEIIEWLKTHKKYEDTIIIYTSDHGDMIGSHELNLKGFELLYEETNRIPLIMVHPDIKGNSEKKMFVSLIDLMPTIADFCCINIEEEVDGKSFANAVIEGSSDYFRDYIISESFEKDQKGCKAYENPEEYTAETWRTMNISIRTEKDKYIFHGKDTDEYYDMTEDPYENWNLYPSNVHGDRVQMLRKLIVKELDDSGTVLAGIVKNKMSAK